MALHIDPQAVKNYWALPYESQRKIIDKTQTIALHGADNIYRVRGLIEWEEEHECDCEHCTYEGDSGEIKVDELVMAESPEAAIERAGAQAANAEDVWDDWEWVGTPTVVQVARRLGLPVEPA